MNTFNIDQNIVTDRDSLDFLDSPQENKTLIIMDYNDIDKFNKQLISYLDMDRTHFLYLDEKSDLEDSVLRILRLRPGRILVLGSLKLMNLARLCIHYLLEVGDLLKEGLEPELIGLPSPAAAGLESSNILYNDRGASKEFIVSNRSSFKTLILSDLLVKEEDLGEFEEMSFIGLINSIDSYIAVTSNSFSNMYSKQSIRNIHKHIVTLRGLACDNKVLDLQLGSLFSGYSLNFSSPGLTFIFSNILASYFREARLAQLMSILSLEIISFNYKNSFLKYKYSSLTRVLGLDFSNPDLNVKALMEYINSLRQELKLPSRLGEINIGYKDLAQLMSPLTRDIMDALQALKIPAQLNERDIRQILLNSL